MPALEEGQEGAALQMNEMNPGAVITGLSHLVTRRGFFVGFCFPAEKGSR